ncbi:MAG TPA: RhuM family protein [Sphingobacteriaceae bacterium]
MESNIIIYQTEDGRTKIETRLEDETVWLTQGQLCDLFQKSKATISEHIRNIFDEGELEENSVVRNFRTTAADNKLYHTNYYNLDVIISVGYRVKSHQGTKFRQWATARREYIVKE